MEGRGGMNIDMKTHDIRTITSNDSKLIAHETIELERNGWKCHGESRNCVNRHRILMDFSRRKDYELINMSDKRIHYVMNRPKISSPWKDV